MSKRPTGSYRYSRTRRRRFFCHSFLRNNMRRPGSSSCLLLPKGSTSYDEGDASTAAAGAEASLDGALSPNSLTTILSVTIINKEKLPTYSSERFFLLSEVEVHAQPTTFLIADHDDSDFLVDENNTHSTAQNSDEDDDDDDEEDDNNNEHEFATGRTSSNVLLTNESRLADFRIAVPITTTATNRRAAATDGNNSNGAGNLPSLLLPNYILLYLLWRPSDGNDPLLFLETRILDAVGRLRDRVTLAKNQAAATAAGSEFFPSTTTTAANANDKRLTATTTASDGGPTSSPEEYPNNLANGCTRKDSHVSTSSDNQEASLYIVVDRLMPTSLSEPHAHTTTAETSSDISNMNTSMHHHHAEQEDLAERLARSVASNPLLRLYSQGITVGVSNHVRAAPALEACVQAIAVGATDRRRHGQQTTKTNLLSEYSSPMQLQQKQEPPGRDASSPVSSSLLGIVGLTPADLLGLQDVTVTDAAQGVLQSKVTAEWNGLGNLQSFAARGHNQWRCRHGVPESIYTDYYYASTKRKVPKRISRRSRQQNSFRNIPVRYNRSGAPFFSVSTMEKMYNVWMYALILFYIGFHFASEIGGYVARFGTSWYDLIRSARGW